MFLLQVFFDVGRKIELFELRMGDLEIARCEKRLFVSADGIQGLVKAFIIGEIKSQKIGSGGTTQVVFHMADTRLLQELPDQLVSFDAYLVFDRHAE